MPRTYARIPLDERFWNYVEKTDSCWNWTGATTAFGHGLINEGGRGATLRTHRLSWELHYGPIPEGLCVCHHCDNPPCVNPAHLFLGTHDDNNKDMQQKGRCDRVKRPKGEQHGMSKLTEQDIATIRQAFSNRRPTLEELGHEYGVTKQTIRTVVKDKGWLSTDGPLHHNAKLTHEAVADIRARFSAPRVLLRDLADRYSVTTTTIHRIVAKKSWAHV